MSEETQESQTESKPATGTDATIYWGTGRRKTSIARVRLIAGGSGQFTVNGQNLDSFFNVERHRMIAFSPLKSTNAHEGFDIHARVDGGGITGQSGAVRLGLARALARANGQLEEDLRNDGHLTRDSRMVERKHYGKRGARRGCQFSKR